jgi:hypothetical protein
MRNRHVPETSYRAQHVAYAASSRELQKLQVCSDKCKKKNPKKIKKYIYLVSEGIFLHPVHLSLTAAAAVEADTDERRGLPKPRTPR